MKWCAVSLRRLCECHVTSCPAPARALVKSTGGGHARAHCLISSSLTDQTRVSGRLYCDAGAPVAALQRRNSGELLSLFFFFFTFVISSRCTGTFFSRDTDLRVNETSLRFQSWVRDLLWILSLSVMFIPTHCNEPSLLTDSLQRRPEILSLFTLSLCINKRMFLNALFNNNICTCKAG